MVVISAHWEEAQPTVLSGAAPPLLFDYYGFPSETYELKWAAPGDPALANRVRALLKVRTRRVAAHARSQPKSPPLTIACVHDCRTRASRAAPMRRAALITARSCL